MIAVYEHMTNEEFMRMLDVLFAEEDFRRTLIEYGVED